MEKRYLVVLLALLNLNVAVHAKNNMPKVYLNHVYIVLDDISFKGIVKSTFYNKKFANIDMGFPSFKPVNENCNVLYLRGRTTYLEIYNSKNPYGLKEGEVGIGFSVEQKNGAKQLYDSLHSKNSAASFSLDSVSVNGQSACAAMYMVTFGQVDSTSMFKYMLSEYHPDIMQCLYKQNFNSKPVKRSDYLKKRYGVDKLLNDITEVNLQLSSNAISPFINLMEQFDYSVSKKNGGYTIKGNDMVIHVKTTESLTPKLDLQFKMNGSKDGNYNLNNAKLDFTGSYGTWSFY